MRGNAQQENGGAFDLLELGRIPQATINGYSPTSMRRHLRKSAYCAQQEINHIVYKARENGQESTVYKAWDTLNISKRVSKINR